MKTLLSVDQFKKLNNQVRKQYFKNKAQKQYENLVTSLATGLAKAYTSGKDSVSLRITKIQASAVDGIIKKAKSLGYEVKTELPYQFKEKEYRKSEDYRKGFTKYDTLKVIIKHDDTIVL